MKKYIYIFFAGMMLMSTSCDKEYLNPSASREEQVVNDVYGLISLANGLQYKYSVSRLSPNYTIPTVSGLLTKELVNLNAGNTDEQLLMQGGSTITGSNSVLTNLWNQSHLVKSNADIILDNLDIVSAEDQGTRIGLQAHAAIFKALALGNLAMFWEQAPLVVEKNAPFVSRQELLMEAIAQLEAASAELAKAPLSPMFTSRIAAGIDYPNTVNALIARYSLMAGDYDNAIAAADKVVLTIKSSFNHDETSRNALFETAFSNRNVTEPQDNKFSLPLELETPSNDQRITFFINATAGVNKGRASFFTANSVSVPIYRIGEISLIKAEALVRKSSPDLNAAVDELNNVLTKIPANDPWGIGANLTAYAGGMSADEILSEIYRQRCIELYLTGLRFEDSRRFGRPMSERGNRQFMPYPFTERDNNTNTPEDPVL